MEQRTKLEIGAFITMALLITGAYFIGPSDNAYYCESLDQVRICDKLSSGLGTRCYFEDTYKICSEGWVKLENMTETKPSETFDVFANGEIYTCEVINGRVNSYSHCISESNLEAYLGELV